MSYDESNFGLIFECIPYKNTLPLHSLRLPRFPREGNL